MKLEKTNGQLYFKCFEDEKIKNLETFETPQNESEEFQNLQKEYLQTESKEAQDKMFMITRLLAVKCIKKECRKKGLRYSSDEIEDKATDTAIEIMNRYQKYHHYIINYIATTVELAIKHQLYIGNGERLEKSALKILNSRETSDIETAFYLAKERMNENKNMQEKRLRQDL